MLEKLIDEQKPVEVLHGNSSVGIGAVYLHVLREIFPRFDPTVNIMVNYRCHGRCRHCLAGDLIEYQRGLDKGLKPEEIHLREEQKRRGLMGVMDDFKGSPKAFLTGGEPFSEGKEAFALIRHAAACFDEVYVDTNGLAIPLDIKRARRFFEKIPSNVTPCLSLDQFHAEVDPCLKERVALCEKLAQEGLCKTAYNIRIPKQSSRNRRTLDYFEASDVLNEYGLVSKYNRDRDKFFVHSIKAASLGVNLDKASSIALDPFDFISHTKNPNAITMFLSPEGEFLNSDHAAFMVPPRPAMSIVGNMFDEGVESVLKRLAKGYFDTSGRNPGVYTLFQQMIANRNLTSDDQKMREIRDNLYFGYSKSGSAAAKLILQAPDNIRWEVPLERSYTGFIGALPKRKRKQLFSDCVDKYLAGFEQDKLPADAWCGYHKLIVDHGQPEFIYCGKYEGILRDKKGDLASQWREQVKYLFEFGRILGVGRQDFFGILCKRLSLTKPPASLEQLLAHIWTRFYQKELARDSFTANEVQRGLKGEEPERTLLYRGDRRQASDWLQSLN